MCRCEWWRQEVDTSTGPPLNICNEQQDQQQDQELSQVFITGKNTSRNYTHTVSGKLSKLTTTDLIKYFCNVQHQGLVQYCTIPWVHQLQLCMWAIQLTKLFSNITDILSKTPNTASNKPVTVLLGCFCNGKLYNKFPLQFRRTTRLKYTLLFRTLWVGGC